MSERLGQCNGACQGGLGEGGLGEDMQELLSLIEGEGQEGVPRGYGIKRGPGHTPLRLSKDETDLGTRNFEGIESDDVSRASAGDLLDVTEREQEIEETRIGVREAGAINSTGEGGDAVWRNRLLPAEKAVLKNYFD